MWNKYRWYSKKQKHKKLPHTKPLLDRIRNGDFDISPILDEVETVTVEYEQLYQKIVDENKDLTTREQHQLARERTQLRNVARLRLMEEGMKDEISRLVVLKRELQNEFGIDYWDEVTSVETGLRTVEQIYWKYKELSDDRNREG